MKTLLRLLGIALGLSTLFLAVAWGTTFAFKLIDSPSSLEVMFGVWILAMMAAAILAFVVIGLKRFFREPEGAQK